MLAWLFRAETPNIDEKKYIVPPGLPSGGECFWNSQFHAHVVSVGHTWDRLWTLDNAVQPSTKAANYRIPETGHSNTLAASNKISRFAEHFHKYLWKA